MEVTLQVIWRVGFFLLYGSVVIIGVTWGRGGKCPPPSPIIFLSKDSFLLAAELRGGGGANRKIGVRVD